MFSLFEPFWLEIDREHSLGIHSGVYSCLMSSLSATPQGPVPSEYVAVGNLRVNPTLHHTVEKTVCPGTGFSTNYFWSCLDQVVTELRPELERCLAKRDELQSRIDGWYEEGKKRGADLSQPEFRPACREFLKEIGTFVRTKGR